MTLKIIIMVFQCVCVCACECHGVCVCVCVCAYIYVYIYIYIYIWGGVVVMMGEKTNIYIYIENKHVYILKVPNFEVLYLLNALKF